MALARMLREDGQRDQARHALALVYDRFTEGFETADLRLARALLEDLRYPFQPFTTKPIATISFFNGWRPGGTGSLRHPAPDFSFFHRIQRTKAFTVGHVGCVHKLRNECPCRQRYFQRCGQALSIRLK